MTNTTQNGSPTAGDNQCDGCQQGAALNPQGLHVSASGRPFMTCQKGRYDSSAASAPAEQERPDEPKLFRHTITLDIRSSDPTAAMYVHDAIRGAMGYVQKQDEESGLAKSKTPFEIRVPFPVPMVHVETASARLRDDEDDPTALWAEIHRLRHEAKGPDGYDTWRDAAVAERRRRADAERVATERGVIAHFDSWAVRLDNAGKTGWVTDSYGHPALFSETKAKTLANGDATTYTAHRLQITYAVPAADAPHPVAQVRNDMERANLIWLGQIPPHGTNLYAGPLGGENEGMPTSQEPKYGIRNNMLYNRASGEFIPFDEPVFLFRARDLEAIAALTYYCNRVGAGEHSDAVMARISHFREFQQWNPQRMKHPDTTSPVADWHEHNGRDNGAATHGDNA
jgi:hypothetical protein